MIDIKNIDRVTEKPTDTSSSLREEAYCAAAKESARKAYERLLEIPLGIAVAAGVVAAQVYFSRGRLVPELIAAEESAAAKGGLKAVEMVHVPFPVGATAEQKAAQLMSASEIQASAVSRSNLNVTHIEFKPGSTLTERAEDIMNAVRKSGQP